MINKILSTTAILGVLALTGYEYLQAVEQQTILEKFVSKGPRFTAQDGQALCERVRALEERLYSNRDAGKTPLACDYDKREK